MLLKKNVVHTWFTKATMPSAPYRINLAVISDDFYGKDYWERIDILSLAIYRKKAPIEAVAFTVEEFDKGDKPVIIFAKRGDVIYAA